MGVKELQLAGQNSVMTPYRFWFFFFWFFFPFPFLCLFYGVDLDLVFSGIIIARNAA